MRKLMKRLHLILSLPAGVFITIICLTGALMSLDEYIRPFWPTWSVVYRQLMFLHRWLLAPDRAIGRMVVAISTIFFITILVSGLIVWIPKKWKKVRQNLQIKGKSKWGRKVFDLHRVLGAYTLIMLLMLCLTGLMWSFEGYRNIAFTLFTVDRVPDRVAVVYRTDRETGEQVKYDFNEMPNSNKVMRWAYLLHTGRWGGWFGPLLTGLTALIGASLPITGYILYYRRIKRKRMRKI